jgi:hypothetical protein
MDESVFGEVFDFAVDFLSGAFNSFSPRFFSFLDPAFLGFFGRSAEVS